MQIKFDKILGCLREQDSSNFSPVNTIYVAKNGNDAIGDGSFGNPYLTIQKAINIATPTDTDRVNISVAPGTYIEQLIFTQGDISVQGQGFNAVVLEWNTYGDVITVDSTSYLKVSLLNLVVNNGGTGAGIRINSGTVVSFDDMSIGANDEACITNGSNFSLAVNGTAFASNNKTGFLMTGGASGYLTNCSFYGNAPTFYDLQVDAGSTLFCSNNTYQNNNVLFNGDIHYTNTTSQVGNDSNVSGTTVKDALNTLLGMIGGGNVETFPIGLDGVSAYKVVYIDSDGKINHASASDTNNSSIVGITLEGGISGGNAQVVKLGSVQNAGWALMTKSRYYLGEDGNLTDVIPSAGFICEVGLAQSATELEIQNLDDIVVIV